MFSARSGSEKWLLYIVTFPENPEQNDQKIRESKEVVFHRPFWFRIFRVGYRKSKNSEKSAPMLRNIPFGSYCYALTCSNPNFL